ncbi:MAG: PDZ domain-containing protein [Bauldia sp.]|nr:PDZ domain-containing protein [Bauldia sp.]
MTNGIAFRFLPALLLAAIMVPATASAQTTGTLHVTVADWLPAWDPDTGGWAVARAGQSVGKLSIRSSEPAAPVPAGEYDVYWFQDEAHRDMPILVAEGVTVNAGQTTDVRVQTGVIIEVADWVPPLGPGGQIRAFSTTDVALNWTTGAPMVLPEGRVVVYWNADATDDLLPIWLGTFDIEASFGGIGTEVRMEEEVTIVRVAPGGPADIAGIRDGDEILAADGTALGGMTLAAAVDLLRGPSGSSLVVSVRRAGGEPFDVTIRRSIIDSQVVVRVDAGIRVVVGPGLPPLGEGGRWFVTYTDDDPLERPLAFAETADATLLVGHTTYDVYWQETATAAPRLVAEDIVVNGGIVAVPIGGRGK